VRQLRHRFPAFHIDVELPSEPKTIDEMVRPIAVDASGSEITVLRFRRISCASRCGSCPPPQNESALWNRRRARSGKQRAHTGVWPFASVRAALAYCATIGYGTRIHRRTGYSSLRQHARGGDRRGDYLGWQRCIIDWSRAHAGGGLRRAEYRSGAGVVISASHNPVADNGIKFSQATVSSLDEVERRIEAAMDSPGLPRTGWNGSRHCRGAAT